MHLLGEFAEPALELVRIAEQTTEAASFHEAHGSRPEKLGFAVHSTCMAASAPNPRLRARIELMIRVAAPALDLLLAAGDRVSRVLERQDQGYAPVRMPDSGTAAPRGLSAYPVRASETRSAR
jgi:hypothetical protein